jgi:uncharacterized protein YndB with AHSA1/START domain
MVRLVVRKTIRAKAAHLFAAWTTPAQLKQWWGPQGVQCIEAEVDLRLGGRYRIANRLPDGKIVWITGEYEVIEAPRKLVYTWRVEPDTENSERVTVEFAESGEETNVVVTHERISSEDLRKRHEQGWVGCLAGLARFVERA